MSDQVPSQSGGGKFDGKNLINVTAGTLFAGPGIDVQSIGPDFTISVDLSLTQANDGGGIAMPNGTEVSLVTLLVPTASNYLLIFSGGCNGINDDLVDLSLYRGLAKVATVQSMREVTGNTHILMGSFFATGVAAGEAFTVKAKHHGTNPAATVSSPAFVQAIGA